MIDARNNPPPYLRRPGWGPPDIPRQNGRLAIVTGPGGIGFWTGLGLNFAGADVILAGRNPEKGRDAIAGIAEMQHPASVRFELLDLASLASIADFARRIAATYPAVEVLVNNAGVLAPPVRKTTADGFELQFGTNHLGHFALTGRLLPLLRRGNHPRVVTVSSHAHRRRGAAIHFDDLQWQTHYDAWGAYSQSKLANLLFTLELQRRSDAGNWGLTAVAAHPGLARTDILENGPGTRGLFNRFGDTAMTYFGELACYGALPTLYAATSPDVVPAGYYGPGGLLGLKGAPASRSRQARDPALAARLWDVSEMLTGVLFLR